MLPAVSPPSATQPAGSSLPGWWTRRPGVVVLLLVVLTFAAYAPAWHGAPLWDDDQYITKPHLRSLAGLARLWTEISSDRQLYPVTYSAFWVQYQLWGDHPLGYHLVNIGLHALNACWVLLILRRLRIAGAELAALVFALHPVMVESVAWITELKNTLSGTFYLAALLVYLRYDDRRRKRDYALALGLFVLALLSKTVTATLPGALLVLLWWQRGRLEWRRDVGPLLPWFGLGALAGLGSAWVEHALIGAEGDEFAFNLVERGLMAGRVVWFYLGKLFWPVNLTFIYPRWHIDWQVWWQYLYPLATGAALAGAWWLRRRSRAPLAALLFFGGTLVPVLGFANVYPFRFSLVADHFQYLASLGIITATVAGLVRGWERWRPRRAGAWLGVVVFGALGLLTWRQARVYRDLETLWRDTLAKNPACWMAHNNLGCLLTGINQPAAAVPHFEQALRLKPDYAEARNNLGQALLQLGRAAAAIEQFEHALQIQPRYPDALYNLGNARLQAGQVAEAIARYEDVLRLKPDYAEAHTNLGSALLQARRVPEAIQHYVEALRLKPGQAEGHNNLGGAFLQAGRLGEAIVQFQLALQLQPTHAASHYNLGLALLMEQQPATAITHFVNALRAQPDHATARFQLALALHELGRTPEAVAHLQESLRRNPRFAPAHATLGLILANQGQLAPAAAHLREAVRLDPGDTTARETLRRIEAALAGTPAAHP